MLPQLTRYLLQFHHVYIPQVGTIRLVQQPARLDVANKLLYPPYFTIQHAQEGWLTKHQLWYFGNQLHFDDVATRNSLEDIGTQLKRSIEQQAFDWHGIGTFSLQDQRVQFQPHQHPDLLQPVTAERVLRENVQHTVLVGDQLVVSDKNTEHIAAAEHHWNWSRIAGWAAVILCLFYILFYLYQHQFSATSTGLHTRVGGDSPPATYVQ